MRYRFKASRLVELRKARGWSRETLAGRSGVSFSSVYAYENKLRSPQIAALFALASALGVEPRDLIDGESG